VISFNTIQTMNKVAYVVWEGGWHLIISARSYVLTGALYHQ